MRHRGRSLLLAIALLGTSACTGGADAPQVPDAAPVVESLAAALEAGDATGVTFTEGTAADAATQLPHVVEGVADLEHSVDVSGLDVVEPTGDSTPAPDASARLTWSWTVADQVWTYDTEAALDLVEGAWQVVWERRLVEPSLGGTEVLVSAPLPARRGDIIGAGGARLVTERDVRRFGINKVLVTGAEAVASAKALARLVGVDPAAYAARVKAAGDRAFVEAIVYRVEDIPTPVAADFTDLPGAIAISDRVPLAPSSTFAAPLLGRVGEVTAEMIAEDPDRYRLGDEAGLSGLSARYDEQLRGTPGRSVDAVASDGKRRNVFRAEPTRGQPLRLTLDERLQRLAETALAGVGPAAALVALQPSTGDIRAAANGAGTEGVNLATYGQAAPGSTFKIVSALALLRAGLTPQSPVPCTSSVVVDGKTFTNYSDYPGAFLGRIPLRSALAHSCNTAFISQAERVDRTDGALASAAASLGFGIDHDLGFPAFFGQVPAPASATEAAADLIGQGAVLASPMAMATVVASVQAGHTVVPRLVESMEVSVPDEAAPLTSAEAAALRQLLRGVVTEGSGSGLADVPGSPVLAKTGTAEFDQGGKRRTHAWMVAAQGDLAVAVFVDVGESGSRTAGPILETFLRGAGGN